MINLVLPNQLFEHSPLLDYDREFILIEEQLFFRLYPFHKQKIAYHRATMLFYKEFLESIGKRVRYITADDELSDIRNLIKELARFGVRFINYIDVCDDWLESRIIDEAKRHNIHLNKQCNPAFLNSAKESVDDVQNSGFYHHKFYIHQRQKLKVLLESPRKPLGGKWSFDIHNRKKYPRSQVPPTIRFPKTNEYHKKGVELTEKHLFCGHVGEVGEQRYPITFVEAENWLTDFINNRFQDFGVFEDALVQGQSILHHSVLSALLNCGLLTPKRVVDRLLEAGSRLNVPMNSLEGIIRQIIGWREFVRGVYLTKGRAQRSKNFWGFKRKIPSSFWDGTTGIIPVDDVIQKCIKTGYNHHIERLMVIGNFMLLCEFDPDEVYEWFMVHYIDAYDWVMVPNVYGMSQFADGGLFATKPYVSGSNYIKKMSNYKNGDWQQIWDSLFWRFLSVHREVFAGNSRIGMLLSHWDKMPSERKNMLLDTAEEYLQSLDAKTLQKHEQ